MRTVRCAVQDLNCVLEICTVGYDVQKDEERARRLHCGMVVATAGRYRMAGVLGRVPQGSKTVLARRGGLVH